MEFEEYDEILGVAPEADKKATKQAFRKTATMDDVAIQNRQN